MYHLNRLVSSSYGRPSAGRGLTRDLDLTRSWRLWTLKWSLLVSYTGQLTRDGATWSLSPMRDHSINQIWRPQSHTGLPISSWIGILLLPLLLKFHFGWRRRRGLIGCKILSVHLFVNILQELEIRDNWDDKSISVSSEMGYEFS